MNLFDRFILTVYSLTLVFVTIFVLGAAVGLIPQEFLEFKIREMYQFSQIRMIYIAAAVILLIISLKFFFDSFKRKAPSPPVVSRTEIGDVLITMDTFESLALKAARKVRGVREVKAKIRSRDKSVMVQLRVVVDGETPIPKLTEELQNSVKYQIETTAGVEVIAVTVYVANVSAPGAGRLARVE